jgi:uncharacterized protein YciI
MILRVAALIVLFSGSAVLADEKAGAPPPPAASTNGRDAYQVVILRRGPKAADFTKAELQKMEGAHQAHLQQLMESGRLLVVGPFADQADPSYRGMCLYQAGSVAEARRLAEADPAVQSGRVRVEVMTWMTVQGALAFPFRANAPSAAK